MTYTDALTRRKRLDAWAVRWGKRCLLIQEITLPNDRDVNALQDTDTLKTAWYTPLRDSGRLAMLLPAWEVAYTAAHKQLSSPSTTAESFRWPELAWVASPAAGLRGGCSGTLSSRAASPAAGLRYAAHMQLLLSSVLSRSAGQRLSYRSALQRQPLRSQLPWPGSRSWACRRQ